MLCAFFEGTEHSPRPHGLLSKPGFPVYPLENCLVCGETLWKNCPDCAGKGSKLRVVGQCSNCGQSIIYWVNCSTCQGVGKLYRPEHACHPKPVTRTTPLAPRKDMPPSRPAAHGG